MLKRCDARESVEAAHPSPKVSARKLPRRAAPRALPASAVHVCAHTRHTTSRPNLGARSARAKFEETVIGTPKEQCASELQFLDPAAYWEYCHGSPPSASTRSGIGGSILSSLSAPIQQHVLVDLQAQELEYDESGPSIVHRKCFEALAAESTTSLRAYDLRSLGQPRASSWLLLEGTP